MSLTPEVGIENLTSVPGVKPVGIVVIAQPADGRTLVMSPPVAAPAAPPAPAVLAPPAPLMPPAPAEPAVAPAVPVPPAPAVLEPAEPEPCVVEPAAPAKTMGAVVGLEQP